MAGLQKVAGSKLYIGGRVPYLSTVTLADFSGQTWLEIDGWAQTGDLGAEQETITQTLISQNVTLYSKGIISFPIMQNVFVPMLTDAGQIQFAAAQKSCKPFAFKIEWGADCGEESVVTITNAGPAVVTWTSHGLEAGTPVTDYIEFPEGARLWFSEQRQLAADFGPLFFDAANNPIWGWQEPTVEGEYIVPPPGAVKLRITLRQTSAPNYQIRLWGAQQPSLAVNPWVGKRLVALGDSITAASYNWPQRLCDLMGMTLHLRAAVGGRQMARALYQSDDVTPLVSGDFASADLTMLFLGTNDTDVASPGSIDDAPGDPTFYGRTKAVIETVMGWQPDQRFVICGLIWRENRRDLVVAYNSALSALADLYALPFIDLRHRSGINDFNASWAAPDGIHPSTDGYDRLLVPALRGAVQGLAPVV